MATEAFTHSLFSEVSTVPVFYPRIGMKWLAGIAQTALATSKLRLFQSPLVPTVLTTKAELVAAEATFSGYPSGGIAVTAFGAPYFPATGNAAINSESVQFQCSDPTTITNIINGAWLETSAGDVVIIDVFPTPVSMATPDNAIPLLEILQFASGL